MADTIAEALEELFVAGMGPAGYYPDVNGVEEGSSKDLFSNAKYPLILIDHEEDSYSNNGNHITIYRNFSIVVLVLLPDAEEAKKIRDFIVLNEFVTPPKGIIPFLLANTSVSIGGVKYYIEMQEGRAISGEDNKGRAVEVAEIPLKLERKFVI